MSLSAEVSFTLVGTRCSPSWGFVIYSLSISAINALLACLLEFRFLLDKLTLLIHCCLLQRSALCLVAVDNRFCIICSVVVSVALNFLSRSRIQLMVLQLLGRIIHRMSSLRRGVIAGFGDLLPPK
jgi:hypothetical protein